MILHASNDTPRFSLLFVDAYRYCPITTRCAVRFQITQAILPNFFGHQFKRPWVVYERHCIKSVRCWYPLEISVSTIHSRTFPSLPGCTSDCFDAACAAKLTRMTAENFQAIWLVQCNLSYLECFDRYRLSLSQALCVCRIVQQMPHLITTHNCYFVVCLIECRVF